jgi:crotonobetainyl-CoA:carnitine CoA-transferase CaiB-like acyl-CoA transferase
LQAHDYYSNLADAYRSPRRSDSLPLRIDGNRDYGWWRRAPMLGEHNMEILDELGFMPSEISSLEAKRAIGNRPATR